MRDTQPFFSIGFRPFYLGAGVFATLVVPAWYGAYAGWLRLDGPLPGLAWHAHEMVFGFAPAVIEGGALAALFLLWALGRMLHVTGPGGLAVMVDLAFLPLLALALAIPLWQARNRRNAFVVVLLLILWGLSAAHLGAYGGWADPIWASRAQTAAMDMIALLLAVIGGRIIPAFSANAVHGLVPKRWPALEAAALGLLGLVALLDLTGLAAELPMSAIRVLLAAAGLAHLARLIGWQPWATRGNLLLLVLPLGYLWLPVHLLLRAWLDPAPGLMAPVALHALSVGAMAGLMLAMMTRSALGHTGRPLVARGAEAFIFGTIHLAALSRVVGPLGWAGSHVAWVGVSALLWALAFGVFAVVYAPIVTRPRWTFDR